MNPGGGRTIAEDRRQAGWVPRADMIARHFKFFLVAAEEQSFQRAAERLHIAQSALSRRISDLERELGNVKLFDRFARGVRLTTSGVSLLEDVRRIMAQIEEASAKAWRVDRGEVGLLRIGFADTTGWKRVIPETLRQFEERYPEVDVQLIPMVSESQRDALRSGAIDLGLMFDALGATRSEEGELSGMPLSLHRFLLVVPEGHRLHGCQEISLAELREENLIWPSRRHAPLLFSRMLDACRVHDFAPRIKIEVIAIDMAYDLVASGLGLAMILAEETAVPPPGLSLRRLSDFNVELHYLMMWRQENRAAPLANFVDLAASVLKLRRPG